MKPFGHPLLFVALACVATLPAQLVAQAWSLDSAVAPVLRNDAPALEGAAFVPTAAGQILAYGVFTHVNGVAAPGLARLEADGRLDTTFAAELDPNERVSAVAPLPDGRVVVLLATTYPTAVVASAAVPASLGATVVSADPSSGLAIGGEATAVSATPGEGGAGETSPGEVTGGAILVAESRIVRLRADGRRDPTFAAIVFNGYPRLLALSDGCVLAWGSFRSAGGLPRNGLARLETDGTLDTAFATSLSALALNVSAVAAAPDGGFVLSAVAFGNGRGSVTTYFLRRVLASGAIDPRFAPAGINTTYNFLAAQPDGGVVVANVYLRGIMLAPERDDDLAFVLPPDGIVPVNFAGLVRYTPTGAIDRTFSAQIPDLSSVSALASLPDGRLAIGATVRGMGSVTVPAVFTLAANGRLERDLRRVSGAGEGQRLLQTLPDGRLLLLQGPLVLTSSYYAVPFDPVMPVDTTTIMPVFRGATMVEPALALSFVDAGALAPLATNIVQRSGGTVSRLETDSAGRTIAAGAFTHVDGEPRAGLARFFADGALDRGFVPTAGGELLGVPPESRPIVRRTVLGPLAADGFHRHLTQIVRLLDSGGIDTAFAFPATLDAARANWLLAAPDGRLLVAAFDPDDSREQNLKLIWLGADGRRLATLPTAFSGFTRLIALPLDINGTAIGSEIVSVYPISYRRPNVIDAAQLLDGEKLLVAGAFSRVNNVARPGIVRLFADGKEDALYAPAIAQRQRLGSVLPLPDGRALVFGSLYAGGRWRADVLRLRADGTVDPTFQPPPDTIASDARWLADGSFFSRGRRFFDEGWPDPNFAPALRQANGSGVAVAAVLGPAGRLWIGGSFTAVDGQPRSGLARFAPTTVEGITVGPRSQTVVAGREAYFQVAVGSAQPAAYRWMRDGDVLPGATRATLRLEKVQPGDAGEYRAVVVVGGRTFTSEPAVLRVTSNTTRLINFSARSRVVAGGATQTAGFVLAAAPPRTVLLRAVGFGLPANPGTPLLPVPVLSLHEGDRLIAQDRGGALAAAVTALARSVGAFPLSTSVMPAGMVSGSAIVATIGAGTYLATTTSGDGNSGLSLFEIYDSGGETSAPLLRNVSLHGQTGAGALMLTAGFVLRGNGPGRLLVRGLGPALTQFGVAEAVADPRLALYGAGWSTPLAENDDWGGAAELAAAAQRAGAFALPRGSRDAALDVTLEPGAYSVQLGAAAYATGTGMIELYVLEP